MVTALASLRIAAARCSDSSSGRTTERAATTGRAVHAESSARCRNTSPGITTTATPRSSTAARIAISRIRGVISGVLTSSQ